jgi:hypothetical protein
MKFNDGADNLITNNFSNMHFHRKSQLNVPKDGPILIENLTKEYIEL